VDWATSTHEQIKVDEAILGLSEPFGELLHIPIDRHKNCVVSHCRRAYHRVFGSLIEGVTMIDHYVASSVKNISYGVGHAFI